MTATTETATKTDVALEDEDFAAPTGPKLTRELATVLQVPRLALQTPQLLTLPRGRETVVVFPGWSTSDAFLLPMRSALRRLGHRAHGWGFGFNTGEVQGMLPSVSHSVEQRAAEAGEPITLIGWSLGGIFARETARDRPDLVRQVITLATPVFGGPKYTRGASTYSNEYVEELAQMVRVRNQIPIECPITAMYSTADAIVDWRACIDTFSPTVENIEVGSTHIGMTIDPDVWKIIAHRLSLMRPDEAA